MTATPDATPDALRAARDALAACCKAAARPFLALPPLSMETQDALMQHFRLQAAPGTQSAPLYWACEHRFMSSLAAQIQMRAARACERMLSPAAAPGPAQPSQLALADAGEIERDLALTVWSARLPPELMQIEEQIAYQIRRALRSVEGQRPGLTPDQQPFTVRRLTLDITTLWDECAQPHGGGVLMFKRHAAALQTVLTDALRGVLEVLDSRYPIPVPRGLPQPEAPAAADTPAELAADDPLHALVLFTAPELADALSDRMAALRTRGRGSDLQPEVERLAAQRSASAPPPARFEPETLVRRTRTLFEELQQLPDLSRFDPSQVETLRLLSRVFLILMRDTKLHPELHTELEDLQAPLLRVALRDPEFFTDFDHPARRAVAQLIASGMNRRVGEAQRVEQLRAALRSAALLLAQARRQAPAQAAWQADADESEAREAAFMAIGERLTRYEMPDFVARMLATHWSELLAQAHLRSSTDPAMWIESLRVLDRLIWSVQLRGDDRFARELTRELPGLVRSVSSGLKAAGANPEVVERFMRQLEDWHLKMLKATSVTVVVRHSARRRAYSNLGQTVARLTRSDLVNMVTEGGHATTGRILWASPAKSRFILARADRRGARLVHDTEVRRLMQAGRLALGRHTR